METFAGESKGTMKQSTVTRVRRDLLSCITELRRTLRRPMTPPTALLYARANAAFQTRFLNPNGAIRLQAIMSGSHLSLSHPSSPVPSPPSPSSPTGGFATTIRPIEIQGTEAAFFHALLDFLYTSSTDMKEAFTFLFEDTAFGSNPEEAQDRLAEVRCYRLGDRPSLALM